MCCPGWGGRACELPEDTEEGCVADNIRYDSSHCYDSPSSLLHDIRPCTKPATNKWYDVCHTKNPSSVEPQLKARCDRLGGIWVEAEARCYTRGECSTTSPTTTTPTPCACKDTLPMPGAATGPLNPDCQAMARSVTQGCGGVLGAEPTAQERVHAMCAGVSGCAVDVAGMRDLCPLTCGVCSCTGKPDPLTSTTTATSTTTTTTTTTSTKTTTTATTTVTYTTAPCKRCEPFSALNPKCISLDNNYCELGPNAEVPISGQHQGFGQGFCSCNEWCTLMGDCCPDFLDGACNAEDKRPCCKGMVGRIRCCTLPCERLGAHHACLCCLLRNRWDLRAGEDPTR